MPNLVKGLAYIEEDCITVFLIFKCFIYISKPMTLLGGGMTLPEAELVRWCPCGRLYFFSNPVNSGLSNILAMTESKLIGLYDCTSLGFLPGSRIIITRACFRVLGQYSSRSIALYKCSRVC